MIEILLPITSRLLKITIFLGFSSLAFNIFSHVLRFVFQMFSFSGRLFSFLLEEFFPLFLFVVGPLLILFTLALGALGPPIFFVRILLLIMLLVVFVVVWALG